MKKIMEALDRASVWMVKHRWPARVIRHVRTARINLWYIMTYGRTVR